MKIKEMKMGKNEKPKMKNRCIVIFSHFSTNIQLKMKKMR